MKKRILITNGSGGSGKDTFANFVLDSYYLDSTGKEQQVVGKKISSIDFVKEMVLPYISNVQKDEGYRKLLSTIKQAFIDYNDLPYLLTISEIKKFIEDDKSTILMADIREPDEIDKVVEYWLHNQENAPECEIITVLVNRPSIDDITSNSADSNVYDYIYDYYIENSGGLEALKEKAQIFTQEIFDPSINKILEEKMKQK